MKYLLFIILLISIGLIAGCINDNSPLPITQNLSVTTTYIETYNTTTTIQDPTQQTTVIAVVATQTTEELHISDEALKAKIRFAENRLELLSDSDIADVYVHMPDSKTTINDVQRSVHCGEVKESKELGYAIDVGNGDMFFVKGWYGYIPSTTFIQNMTVGHTYVLIHNHPNDWKITCTNMANGYTMEKVSTQSTFSVEDLEWAGDLAQAGYNIKTIIVDNTLSENSYIYETHPKIAGDWKTKPEIESAISRIESRMETSFNNTMGEHNVDSLMPLLTKELNYTYIVQGIVIS
jgi:hypothetical protein